MGLDIFIEISALPFFIRVLHHDPTLRIGKWVSDIGEDITLQEIIKDKKIDAYLTGSYNKILRKGWKTGFLNYIQSIQDEITVNKKYKYESIDFVFKQKSHGDLNFMLSSPTSTNLLGEFKIKLKKEIKQIPENKFGIMVLITPSLNESCLKYAQILVNEKFIGLVVIHGHTTKIDRYILSKNNLDPKLIRFMTEHLTVSNIFA